MGFPGAVLVALDGSTKTPPPDNDVVAGWGAFALFLGLCVAVALLGWSLSRQFKKVAKAREEGVFGPEDESPEETERTADAGESGEND